MPTLKAMWSPKGQQVMISTPAQPKKRYGIGAVDYHTGETVVLIRRRPSAGGRRPNCWKRFWRSIRRALSIRSLGQLQHPRGRRGRGGPARSGWPLGAALPAHLQPLVESYRDALASLQARGDPLRVVLDHQSARCGGLRLL